MANVKFYLDKKNDGEGNPILLNIPIFLFYSFNGKRLKYFTGERIDAKHYQPTYWKQNKAPVKTAAPNSEIINRNLKSIRIYVETIHSDAIALGIPPTIDFFKKRLEERFKSKGDSTEKEILVYEAIEEFLCDRKEHKTHNTYRTTQSFTNHLKVFIGEGKIKRLTFNEIDNKFIDRFNKYLISDLKMLNNTVAKNMKALRTFLNFCKNPQRKYYAPIETVKFQIKENEPAIIALKESEVEHLYNFQFESEKLQRVRDVFVFGCYTGLRYSDLKKIKKTSIEGDFIKFNISKSMGTEEQTVPLLPIAKEILNKYKELPIDQALPVLSNQKMNDYIKDLCKEAKLDQIITITELQSGKKTEKEFKKYELITCHTCRKTFISMLINKGVPEAIIKSITGHIKDSKAFVRYYQIDNDEKLEGISKAFNV